MWVELEPQKIAVGSVALNLHAERIATKTDYDLTVLNLTNGSGTRDGRELDPRSGNFRMLMELRLPTD